MNDFLIEHVAKAIFDHEQNRPFPPKLVNMSLYGQHPVTWEFINDERFVESCSNQYRDMARSVIKAMQSYKHSSDIPTIRIVNKVQANRGYLPGDYDNAMVPSGEPTKVCENLSKHSESEHPNAKYILRGNPIKQFEEAGIKIVIKDSTKTRLNDE